MASIIKTIKRLEYLNHLIKKRATGDLETLSRKMNLSKRTVSEILSEMREMGASINYDRNSQTYYYAENGEFCIAKFLKYGQLLERAETSNIGSVEDLCFSEKDIFVICEENQE